jgi:glycosyltransferase involved in cell wall biosynthesis
VNLALVPGLRPHELLDRLPGLGRFAASLAEEGARVTVLARAEEEADLRVGRLRLVAVRDGDEPFRPLRDPSAAVAATLRRLAPDVVHVGGFLFPVPVAAFRAALPRRVPILLQHHGEPPGEGRLGLLQRSFLRFADGVLVTCREIADEWIARGLVPRGMPVHEVLEASTDLRPVDRDGARAAARVDGEPAVLWVGRLHPRKDPLTALRAFEAALRRLPSARLHLVFGEAPLLGEVKALCAASPALARATRFVGPVPHEELPAWYSAADLFLTSSSSEGSNWALIEAMACGLPAVATAIPANRRVAAPGTAFFPPGDPEAGGEAIVRAALAPPARGAQIRDHFERRLSWGVVAREALAGYRSALARKGGA